MLSNGIMPQLLVRDLESSLVSLLRKSAAEQGVSVEEAHRRLLRSSLFGNKPGPQSDFIEYLRDVPKGAVIEFPRQGDLPRDLSL